LWCEAQTACGIDAQPSPVHAETSMRMMARLDPETNILRSTIAAFAAGAGGADTICVLPHTIAHGLPDAFARRVARNTQLVLIHEAHLDHVADPAAGSGGIEHLTDRLCEAAWTEFQSIEAEGGIFDSLLKGNFQTRVADAHARRVAQLQHGERHIVGTTIYPAKEERPVSVLEKTARPSAVTGIEQCEAMPLRSIGAITDEAA
jgi:methylmalonyl-CoA mutase